MGISMMTSASLTALAIIAALTPSMAAFLPKSGLFGGHQRLSSTNGALFASVDAAADLVSLSLSLTKPLGMLLEEVQDAAAEGVFVKELAETGSAREYQDQIVGAKLTEVQGLDVTTMSFDSVMEAIVAAPDTVDLQFLVKGSTAEAEAELTTFADGSPVTIRVQQDGQPDLVIDAKVGDNLRQTLLDNNFEVYQGIKQKLGNCGGNGQCTFCAVEGEWGAGWLERSEYEDTKLKKLNNPAARLACLNNIQGPATIRKAKR